MAKTENKCKIECLKMMDVRYDWKKLNDEDSFTLKVLAFSKPTFIFLEDARICVVRLPEGWFGIHNVCPHAGAALHKGHCNKKGIIACPLHGYKFDVKTGRSIDGNNYFLKTYKIENKDDGFYIGIKKY